MYLYIYRLSDYEREHPPPPGSIITYRYQELSEKGIPRFPTYVCVRYRYDHSLTLYDPSLI